ncbi:MAG: HAMP domain-containing protein [Dehalococcoidia bacterium]|nr:HAMP domain-containing protein [Dehalococcoidia bacterium]
MPVRLQLTLSYAGFLVFAGLVVLAGVYLVLRYGPDQPIVAAIPQREGAISESKEMALLGVSGLILVGLAVIGLVGGWFLAGRMLRPLRAITATARLSSVTGSLDHRVRLPGRRDEFTELADTYDAMMDRLQQSFEEQQRFAANASHELRTPLAVMKTMLDVAAADPGRQDIPRLIRRLRETNKRGIDIVETLLALSALDQGMLDRQRVDLALIVDDASDVLLPEADDAGIRFDANVAPCEVDGNAVLLHQLVMNLGQNGIRHNEQGGAVYLGLTADPSDASRCLLMVRNTGAILNAEVLSTLTEPFVRGRGRVAALDGRHRGHGLGLALVQRIAEAHDGCLDLRPNVTGGLTATVSLPLREGAQPTNHGAW